MVNSMRVKTVRRDQHVQQPTRAVSAYERMCRRHKAGDAENPHSKFYLWEPIY